MRNLQGSTDAELDHSMGRKAARLAAKPHVVGSIALDQRLRGGGGGGGGDPLRFDSGSITKGTFGTTFSFDAQFQGGMPPYSAVCVPEAVGFGGINGSGRSTGSGMDPAIGYVMTVTDSLGASVDLLLNVFGFANNETRPLPLPPSEPVNQTLPVLTSPDQNLISYAAGTWTGAPAPTLRAELYDNDDDTVLASNLSPGMHPIMPDWRGRNIALDEYADNGFRPIPRATTQTITIPATLSLSFPWDAMTTHAQIDAWADANGVARGSDWAQMTIASKRAWLVAYYDGDRPWETAS